MARRTLQKRPDTSVPAEQALVTPQDTLPAVAQILHGQQQNQILQDIGAFKAEIGNLKASEADLRGDIGDLKKLANRLAGILIGAGFVITLLGGIVWFLAGSKVSTLLKMADDQQAKDRKMLDDKRSESLRDTQDAR